MSRISTKAYYRIKELKDQGARASYIRQQIELEFGTKITKEMMEKTLNSVEDIINTMKMPYDETDFKILEILIRNARTTQKQIGKEIGLSDVGVNKRMKKMGNYGIIERYTVLINPNKIALEDYLGLYKDFPFLILDPSAVHLDNLEKLKEFYNGKNILYGGSVLISQENIGRFKEELTEGVAKRFVEMMKVYFNSMFNK